MEIEETQDTGDHNSEAAAPLVEGEENFQPEQQQQENRNVPLDALESERSKRQHLEEENRMMKEHFALLQSRQAPKPPPKDDFDGLDDSDVMTVGEFKKLTSSMATKFERSVDEMKMSQRYPDYQDVITQHLPDILKQNPSLRESLQKTQDYELAYYLAKNSDTYRGQNKKRTRNADAERIMKNTQSAGTLSSVGPSTAVSHVKSYKNMSDTEFRKEMQKNLGY